VRYKISISFCGGSKIFQKHVPCTQQIKAAFFSHVCVILPCFVYIEYYLIVIFK